MRRAWLLLVGMVLGMGLGPGPGAIAHAQAAGAVPSRHVARWPDRFDAPLRVFVDPAPHAGWSEAHQRAVRAAFDRWVATGIPLRLAFVTAPGAAEVTVRTVDRFPDGISGRTTWRRDGAGWMQHGAIVLARYAADGSLLTAEELHAVALHEIGHLLGLPHVSDGEQIMASRIRVRSLSPADEHAVRRLYRVGRYAS